MADGIPEFHPVPDYLHAARAEQARAEARKAEAEALGAEYDAEKGLILLDREKEKRNKELVQDDRVHIYRFLGEVGSASVKSCIDELTVWSRLDPGCNMTLILHSPGGDVVAGMALFDALQEFRTNGHYLTTVARGYAASMAGIILQAGDMRIMGQQAWLLIHEGNFGAVGSVGEVEDRVLWVKKIQERIVNLFMSRIEKSDSSTATKRLTRAQLKTKMHRTDWWIDSDSALKFGLIDKIA